jgi:hypothetical protein
MNEATTTGATISEAYGGNGTQAEPDEAPRCPRWQQFPVDLLPEPMGSYVADCARARQCDAAAVALPLLSGFAGVIGTARQVRIAPDWTAPAVLWTAVNAASGAVKTPAHMAGILPVLSVTSEELHQWRGAHEQNGSDDERPPEPRLVVADTTIEALATVLSHNPRGLFLARDELSGWLRSFDRYTGHRGADQAQWLELYRANPLSVDRKKDGHIYVARAAVSITGTIQPDVLREAVDPEQVAAGLLARFLLASPPEPQRSWMALRDAQAPDLEAVTRRVRQLHELNMSPVDAEPVTLPLSNAAQAAFGSFFEAHNAERRDTDAGPWRAALSKLEETPARLALMLELARSPNPAHVTENAADSMLRAIELTGWFKHEADRLYDRLAEAPSARVARELTDWISERGSVTAREVAQGARRFRGAGGMGRATEALEEMVADGRLERRERRGRRGPPTTEYLPRLQSTDTRFCEAAPTSSAAPEGAEEHNPKAFGGNTLPYATEATEAWMEAEDDVAVDRKPVADGDQSGGESWEISV